MSIFETSRKMTSREQTAYDLGFHEGKNSAIVHGQWVGIQYDGYADGYPVYDLWECSNCREEYESEGDPPSYNYCPNCGADMRGDGDA